MSITHTHKNQTLDVCKRLGVTNAKLKLTQEAATEDINKIRTEAELLRRKYLHEKKKNEELSNVVINAEKVVNELTSKLEEMEREKVNNLETVALKNDYENYKRNICQITCQSRIQMESLKRLLISMQKRQSPTTCNDDDDNNGDDDGGVHSLYSEVHKIFQSIENNWDDMIINNINNTTTMGVEAAYKQIADGREDVINALQKEIRELKSENQKLKSQITKKAAEIEEENHPVQFSLATSSISSSSASSQLFQIPIDDNDDNTMNNNNNNNNFNEKRQDAVMIRKEENLEDTIVNVKRDLQVLDEEILFLW